MEIDEHKILNKTISYVLCVVLSVGIVWVFFYGFEFDFGYQLLFFIPFFFFGIASDDITFTFDIFTFRVGQWV